VVELCVGFDLQQQKEKTNKQTNMFGVGYVVCLNYIYYLLSMWREEEKREVGINIK